MGIDGHLLSPNKVYILLTDHMITDQTFRRSDSAKESGSSQAIHTYTSVVELGGYILKHILGVMAS